jgi:hypothetical protein
LEGSNLSLRHGDLGLRGMLEQARDHQTRKQPQDENHHDQFDQGETLIELLFR